MSVDKGKDQCKLNFLIDCDTVAFVKEQLGVQSLSMATRKLLVLFANDSELQSRVCSLNCDTQSGYEKLQQNQ